MLITKTNPEALDQELDKLQKRLYATLVPAWGIVEGGKQYDAYPRCYRNYKDSVFIPEAKTTGADYQELFFDDTKAAITFFGCDVRNVNSSGRRIAQVHLIGMCDLSVVKPNIAHRADEEVMEDVMSVLRRVDVTITRQLTGIDNVFKEYTGWKKETGIAYKNMQPFFCFRFDMEVPYEDRYCKYPISQTN